MRAFATGLRLVLVGVVLAAALGLAACAREDTRSDTGTVAQVTDGDTLALADGRRVRLVQIDAPEVQDRECFGADATAVLHDLAPEGTEVRLVRDPVLDNADRFGRILRYVFVDGQNVNLELVRRGAAAPYFFGGTRGRYADRLLRAAEDARERGAGLWGACPGTELAPERAVATGPERL